MGDPFIDVCKGVSHPWDLMSAIPLVELVPQERGIGDGFLGPLFILGQIQRGKFHRRTFYKIL